MNLHRTLLAAVCAASLTLGAGLVRAQAPAIVPENAPSQDATVLPIWGDNGQVQAVLVLEPQSRSSLDRLLGRNQGLGAGFVLPAAGERRVTTSLSIENNPTVGLLCQGRGVTATLGSLAEHCLLADFSPSNPLAPARPAVTLESTLQGERASLSARLGLREFDNDLTSPALPGAVAPLHSPLLAGARIEQRDLGLSSNITIGTQGWISIGGTLAHARIIPASQLPGGLPPEWNAVNLTVGAGSGNFGAEIIGRIIEIPGQTTRYSTVGLGLTWRTPWRSRVTVGAENLASRGQNPFAPEDEGNSRRNDEGKVPYVRYEQDL